MKKIPTEEDLIRSNIDGFGNEVGKVTNRVTSMYDVQAMFEPGSVEYETLAYRIQCGQLYQQNTIDKTKGIISKPMPTYWYDKRAITKAEQNGVLSAEEAELNRRIVAEKKPYFMRYVYPVLMKDYKQYINRTEEKALGEFRMTIQELEALPEDKRTERQKEFLKYYNKYMPVGMNDCAMNRICRMIELKLREIKAWNKTPDFDYTIMKFGVEYNKIRYYSMLDLFRRHNERLRAIVTQHSTRTISDDMYGDMRRMMIQGFSRDAALICTNQAQLCDIVLDICYTREETKQFAWDVAPTAIIESMLKKSGGVLYYPAPDNDGDIEYCSRRYSMKRVKCDGYGDYLE